MCGPLLAAKVACAQMAALVAAEYYAEVFLLDDGATGLAAQHLDSVLVSEVVAALDGLECVLLPAVAAVCKGSIDAALSGVGVAAHWMHLGDDSDVSAGLVGRQGSAQSCETGAND